MFGPNSTPELVSANEIADYSTSWMYLKTAIRLENLLKLECLARLVPRPNATKFSPVVYTVPSTGRI
ncbi:hypothetical protein RHS01_05992 [Rhizoctonia solani]|uniref:Uncharacterized protein n=1 Tax=Rhizoctonia solani TaxID=456999 RepID=A0A8H7IA47_9AGAM|nr:hypothetical protein RHS01_05992 [Rhizoctonia solani]